MKSNHHFALLRPKFRTRVLLSALICFIALAVSSNAFGMTRVRQAQADLSVSKSGDDAVPRGGQITYTIFVFNAGPDDAANVAVTDPLPANTSFVSANASQGTVMFAANTITANFGTILLNEGAQLTVVVTVNNNVPRGTMISNTATATSDTPDPNPDDNSSTFVTAVSGAFAGDLVISEFRLSGPGTFVGDTPGRIKVGRNTRRPSANANSPSDEFIEIYNNTGGDHQVVSASGSGYGVVASDGVLRCTIPNNTVIPRNGHFLCVNTNGYSLSGYPAGNGTTATGNANYNTDIPDNAGIALFNNNSGDYAMYSRLDAVGSTAESNALYKEGTGYPALSPSDIAGAFDYSLYRDNCGRQGVITQLQPCTITTGVIDTDDNAHDFIYVDTGGNLTAAGQRLGAPGPENLSSPVESNATYVVTMLDPCVSPSLSPNQVRDNTADPQNNSPLGTIDLRRTITNTGAGPATRLRFRVTQQTTFPAPSGTADLRLRTSPDITATVDREPCGDNETSVITVNGTTLETPPFQINGGAFNSTVTTNVDTGGQPGAVSPFTRPGTRPFDIVLAQPLNVGESIDVHFLYGVKQSGKFRITLNIEVLESMQVEGIVPIGRGRPR